MLKQINERTGERKTIATTESASDGSYSLGNQIDRSATDYKVKVKRERVSSKLTCDSTSTSFSL